MIFSPLLCPVAVADISATGVGVVIVIIGLFRLGGLFGEGIYKFFGRGFNFNVVEINLAGVGRFGPKSYSAHLKGDKAGAVSAYKEVLRLLQEEWGIVSGEERDEVERAIQKLG